MDKSGSHRRFLPVGTALTLYLLLQAATPAICAEPEPEPAAVEASENQLELLAPRTTPTAQTVRQVFVTADGAAILSLKRKEDADATIPVELRLSDFRDESAPDSPPAHAVFVDSADPITGSLVPVLTKELGSTTATDLKLRVSGLQPGKPYRGALHATIGNTVVETWKLELLQPGTLSILSCPAPLHVLSAERTADLRLPPTLATPTLIDKPIEVELSPLLSEDQSSRAVVEVHPPQSGDTQTQEAASAQHRLGKDGLSARLVAISLKAGTQYTGTLTVRREGLEIVSCPISLLLPAENTAKIQVIPATITRTVRLPFKAVFAGSDLDQASLQFQIANQSPSNPVRGLRVSLEDASETPDGTFDLGAQTEFHFVDGPEDRAGTPVALTHWTPGSTASAGTHTLSPGAVVDIALTVKELRAGKYQFVLPFSGANTEPSNQDKLTVNLNVKHHWGWAAIALTLALMLSWILSKAIINWRERVRLNRRIRQLRPGWLDGMDQLPPAVWQKAVLKQCERLVSATWYMEPAASIADYLQRAGRVLRILKKRNAVLTHIDRAQCRDRIKHYFRQDIAGIMRRIGPEALDESVAQKIVDDLNVVIGRVDLPLDWYSNTIQSKAKLLIEHVDTVSNDRLGDATLVEKLIATLKAAPKTSKQEEYGDAFWKLKLLYSRRGRPKDVQALAEEINQRPDDIESVLARADTLTWEHLSAVADNVCILINDVRCESRPGSEGETPEQADLGISSISTEALVPIQFTLDFTDPGLQESFLVNNVLEYHWQFALYRPQTEIFGWTLRKEKRLNDDDLSRSVTTTGPRVCYYAPRRGRLEVKLSIRWRQAPLAEASNEPPQARAPIPVRCAPSVSVNKNSELRFWKQIAVSQVTLFILVFAITLLGGMASLYVAKATFGAFGDYVALLTWAVGVDQSKNFIQMLKSYSGAPAEEG